MSITLTPEQQKTVARLREALERGDWTTREQRAQNRQRRLLSSEGARLKAFSIEDLKKIARLIRGELKERSALKRAKRRTIEEADPQLLRRVAAEHDFARRVLRYGADEAQRLVAMMEGVPQKTAERYITRALKNTTKK